MHLEELRDRLRAVAHRPAQAPPGVRQAAVAVLLRQGADGAEVLLIERARLAGDRWSGHMAFPGGKVDPEDRSTRAAAVRETWEELGLRIDRDADHLAALAPVPTLAPGSRWRPMGVWPHVFALRAPVVPNPGPEVQRVVSVPWDWLADPANRSRVWRRVGGVSLPFGCYRYGEHIIWGLTWQMLRGLVRVVGR